MAKHVLVNSCVIFIQYKLWLLHYYATILCEPHEHHKHPCCYVHGSYSLVAMNADVISLLLWNMDVISLLLPDIMT